MERWITFDLDGTLMQNPFGAWIFPEIETLVSEELGAPYKAKMKLLERHERLLHSGQTVAAYDWDALAAELARELGLKRVFSIEELVLKHAVPPKIYLLDDTVIPALDELRREGYKLAAVTNGYYAYQFPVLRSLGLAERLDEIVTPERAGFAKPDTRILDGLRRRGTIAAHVGDRLDHDAALARAAGITPVLVNRSMPDELTALPPGERTNAGPFAAFLQRLAARENPAYAEAPLPDQYRPDYAIRELRELRMCL
ncbi:HAD family hydrolase [Paenibacillus humicola]|uniref:HAD family hydrolase n=1 Tax=Paenibacillus humicola TaxID=3110540 RepID=UPI00237A0F41|nr:HAD family hydrolase [Paenibacillus humicola]